MPAPPYIKFYVSDYLADAGHLSVIEHGAYLLLVMSYWQRQRPLPDDDRKLARFARATPEQWSVLRPVLEEFFVIDQGTWSHRRIDSEIRSYGEKRTNAKRAINSRWSNEKRTNNDCDTDVLRSNYQSEPEPDISLSDDKLDSANKPKSENGHGNTAEAVSEWNALAGEMGLSQVQRLTKSRKSKLQARLRDCGGLQGFRSALVKIRGSPFCLGDNDRGWKVSFDSLIAEQFFTRLMEGRYDGPDRSKPGQPNADSARAAVGEALADLMETGRFSPGSRDREEPDGSASGPGPVLAALPGGRG